MKITFGEGGRGGIEMASRIGEELPLGERKGISGWIDDYLRKCGRLRR